LGHLDFLYDFFDKGKYFGDSILDCHPDQLIVYKWMSLSRIPAISFQGIRGNLSLISCGISALLSKFQYVYVMPAKAGIYLNGFPLSRQNMEMCINLLNSALVYIL